MTYIQVNDKHDKLRDILAEYGEEYGDEIIDKISTLFNYPTTQEGDRDNA